jgi:putative DNA primase/helicase
MSALLHSWARALGGVVSAQNVLCPGPGHSSADRSLCVTPAACSADSIVVHSFSGDDWRACRDYVLSRLGAAPFTPRPHKPSYRPFLPEMSGRKAQQEAACGIWNATKPAKGTRAEAYLNARGLELPDCENIRCHPALKHPDGGLWPAMVCLVDRGIDEAPLGIHRTFLSGDGAPSKAPISPNKMMLGPCRGGAVRLRSPKYGFVLISEGIETGLAAMRAVDKPVWAALSTSGMKTLWLPPHIKDVTILADGDNPGEAAARDAALHWKNEGRRVRIARPPQGMDFNDLLMGRPPSIEGGAR